MTRNAWKPPIRLEWDKCDDKMNAQDKGQFSRKRQRAIKLDRLISTMARRPRILTNPGPKFTSPPSSTLLTDDEEWEPPVRREWDDWEDKVNPQDNWIGTKEDKALGPSLLPLDERKASQEGHGNHRSGANGTSGKTNGQVDWTKEVKFTGWTR